MNYYQARTKKPFHLSVGAVVLTKDHKILTHFWKKKRHFTDLYLLMRETLEENETLETALHRGLNEEMSIKGEIVTYIGAQVSNDDWFGEIDAITKVQKTTLYFLVKELTRSKRKETDDEETDSDLLEMDIDELMNKMQAQSKKYHIEELDASSVLESVKEYLSTHPDC